MASCSKTYILAVLMALASIVASMPSDFRTANKLDLSIVINKTVCPVEVYIDEDPARVPQKIKTMKCALNVNRWCAAMNVPKNECCQHQHDDVKLECVEVQDEVMVYFPKLDRTQPYRVSVGCTCMMSETAEAPEAVPA